MSKICFVGLYEDKNLGDSIIAVCTEHLFKKYMPSLTCTHATLDYSQRNMAMGLGQRVMRKIYKLSKPHNRIDYGIYYESKKYFIEAIKGADAVVVVGGGQVKYKNQHLHEHLSALIAVAEKLDIDVFLNSVGVEGFDENDERCMFLKEHLNMHCVKRITVRDDIETLNNNYIYPSNNVFTKFVADPAVWSAEIFGVKHNVAGTEIGIGIARGTLFEEYDIDFSEKDITSLYVDVVKTLIEQGQQVTLFSNGLGRDNDELYVVRDTLSKEEINVKYVIPETAKQLVEMISNFKAIIATRLHSCIVAYSLGIPAVGLVWNNKLRLWGKNIGCQESFVEPDNTNATLLTRRLLEAISEGYDMKLRDSFRDTIKEDIKEISTII